MRPVAVTRRPYMRRVRQKFKEQTKALLDYLKSRPCADCGGTYPPIAMDFDHRPGETKQFCLSDAGLRSWPRILDEARKCDVVCANCHRIRTWERRQARS